MSLGKGKREAMVRMKLSELLQIVLAGFQCVDGAGITCGSVFMHVHERSQRHDDR